MLQGSIEVFDLQNDINIAFHVNSNLRHGKRTSLHEYVPIHDT